MVSSPRQPKARPLAPGAERARARAARISPDPDAWLASQMAGRGRHAEYTIAAHLGVTADDVGAWWRGVDLRALANRMHQPKKPRN